MEKRVGGIDNRHGKAEALLTTVSNEMQVAETEHSNFWKETISRLEMLEEKQETIQKNRDRHEESNHRSNCCQMSCKME